MISLPPEERIQSPYYWVGKLQLQLFQAISEYLERNNMTRKEFAEQLGVSKGYVSQIMNGHFDHKLSKMMELMLAIGMVPSFEMVPLEEAIAKAKKGKTKRGKPKSTLKRKRAASKKEAVSKEELMVEVRN